MNNGTSDNPTISPVVANGVVYFAENLTSQVAAFDAASGAQLWNSGTKLTQPAFASPTVVNGHLFVADSDKRLYAFGL